MLIFFFCVQRCPRRKCVLSSLQDLDLPQLEDSVRTWRGLPGSGGGRGGAGVLRVAVSRGERPRVHSVTSLWSLPI